MIQAGLKTIDIIQWEQAVPERQFVVIDFLRTLSSHQYESICIINADMLFPLSAIHFGAKEITWYSKNDILDNYFLKESHQRIEKDFNQVSPKKCDLIIFSMNEVLQSPFPLRWMTRMLNKTNKRAVVLNTNVAFDKRAQAVNPKKVFNELLESISNKWEEDKYVGTRFNGYHELKFKK